MPTLDRFVRVFLGCGVVSVCVWWCQSAGRAPQCKLRLGYPGTTRGGAGDPESPWFTPGPQCQVSGTAYTVYFEDG
jgi:hypothetical protein